MTSAAEKGKSIKRIYEGKITDVNAPLVIAAKATASTATQVVEKYRDILQPAQIRDLEEIRLEAESVAEAPEEEGWRVLAGLNRKQARTLDALLEEQKRRRVDAERGRKVDRARTLLGWGILITLNIISWAIALHVIQWPQGG